MRQIVRRGAFQIEHPASDIFPLFTPVGETLWIREWKPEYIYPVSGEAGEGTIWKTTHGKHETIWVTVTYDEENRLVSYVNITPGVNTVRVDVHCEDEGSGTRVQVKYTYTALSPYGEQGLGQITDAAFSQRMDSWQRAINHYLENGEAISLSH